MLDVFIPLEKNLTSQVPGITFFSAFKEAFLFKKEKKNPHKFTVQMEPKTQRCILLLFTTKEIPFPTLNES